MAQALVRYEQTGSHILCTILRSVPSKFILPCFIRCHPRFLAVVAEEYCGDSEEDEEGGEGETEREGVELHMAVWISHHGGLQFSGLREKIYRSVQSRERMEFPWEILE